MAIASFLDTEALGFEVSDFIDFVIHKHQAKPDTSQAAETIVETWSQWFETVDHLDVIPSEAVSNYQQLLLEKYRQQGLELRSCAMQGFCFV